MQYANAVCIYFPSDKYLIHRRGVGAESEFITVGSTSFVVRDATEKHIHALVVVIIDYEFSKSYFPHEMQIFPV